MAHSNRLQNARVLVFGGTSGIGYGVASMALSNNAIVTISGSTQAKSDAKANELRSLYANAQASGIALDLSATSDLEEKLTALLDKATENGANKFDHVVFCSGDALTLPTLDKVTYENVFDGGHVRFAVPLLVAKLLATGKYLHQKDSSSYTLTGGTNSAKPGPGWFMGASWGAALEGLSRGLAVDMAPVRVNLVHPGAIDTPMLQGFMQTLGEEKMSEFKRASSLLERWGDVQDIAETYGWFMRDRFATGTIASCDGGRLLK